MNHDSGKFRRKSKAFEENFSGFSIFLPPFLYNHKKAHNLQNRTNDSKQNATTTRIVSNTEVSKMPMFTYARPLILSPLDAMSTALVDYESALSKDKSVKTKNQDDLNRDFRVSLDLPGVKVNDLQINVDQGVLNISGFRRILSREGETSKRNRFNYSVQVEDDTDLSKIHANLSDGVLVITAPKKARPEPMVVPISTESHETFAKRTYEKNTGSEKQSEAKAIEEKVSSSDEKTKPETVDDSKDD